MTMRHNIDAKKTMPILCLAFMLSLAPCSYAQLPAPTSVSISEVAHTSFEVTFDDVSGASSYQVTTTAMHDPSDTVTTSTSGLSLTVTDRRSNINYEVAVRALDASSQLGDSSSAITARTAPGGSSVFYAITTPTFITVFLEETPGATAWEIEYTNSVTSETNSLEVPAGTPSNTLYVAIIQPLNPNTEYRIRVRVSQINLATNYDVTQSPYGESINYTTDRLSAFGRIELITRSYSAGDNDDETLKNEIATELQAAYRSVSSDVFSVSVVQLEQYPGTTNTLCHYEILLNDRSSSPDVTAIAIDDSTLYRNQTVLYDASSRLGDYKLEENPSRTTLSYQDGTHCDTRTLATDTRIWTLFDKTGEIQSAEVDGANPTPADLIFFEFSDSDIKSSSDTIFTLSPNSIYGIKQNYLLKTCISSDGDVTIYDRQYGAFSENTRPPSNRYTIFHSTGLANLNTSIDFSTDIDGTGVTLRIPSTFASRATLYQFTVDGTAHPSLTLNEEDLDSSEFYLVPISGLTADVVSTISVTVTARADDSFNSSDFITVDVTPDVNECLSTVIPNNCNINAECMNNIGSFSCSCNDGYAGNGTFCTDINECTSIETPHDCDGNAICSNTEGAFNCTCNPGYTGDGKTCADVDECISTAATHNCNVNARCSNTPGNYTCTCNSGFVGDGESCEDINECTDTENPHNCDGTPDNSWILLVVILSLTGLVVLLTGVLIYRYYTRHNGTRKSYDLEKARRKQNFVTEIDKDKSQIRNFFFFGKKGLYKVTDYDKQEQDRYRLFNQTGNYDVTRDQAAPPKGKKQSNKKSPRHQKGFYDLEKARQKSKQETKDHSKRLNIFGFYRQKGTDNFFAILYDRSSSTNEGIRSDNPSMLQAERRLGEFDDLAVVPDRPPIQKPVGMINRAYLPSESENLQETSFNTSDNFPDRSSTGYSSSPSNVEEDCCRDDASDTPSKDTSPISSSGDEHGKGNYNLRGAQNDFDKEKKQKSKRKGSQSWFNHKGKYDLQNAEEDFYKRKERPSKKDKAQSKKGSYDVREAETKIGLHDVPSAGAIHVSDVRIESRDSARGVEGIANQSFVDSDQDATSNETDAKASSTVSSVPSTAKRRNGSTNSSFSSGDEHARGTYDFTKAQKEFDKEKKKKSKRKGSQRWFKHKGKYDLRDAEEEFVKNEERQSRSEDNSPAKTGNYDVHGAEVEFGIRRDTTEKEDTSRVISVSDKPLEPNGGQNREGFSNSAYEGQDPDSPDQS